MRLSKEDEEILNNLEEVGSSALPFLKLRKLHRDLPNPCIPYLGLYFTDLTFILEGNSKHLDNGLINMGMHRSLAKCIRDIKSRQITQYNFLTVPKIANLILPNSLPTISEEELYRMSCEIEPRQPKIDTKKI